MFKIFFISTIFLVFLSPIYAQYGLQTFFEMQRRVWISQSDLTTLLLAAGVPKCIRPCITGLVSAASDALRFNDSIITGVENLCKEYKSAKQCVGTSKCGNHTIFTIFTKGLESACGENYHMIYFVKPCLDQYAQTILQECDGKCDLSMKIEELTRNKQIAKLVAKGGNAISLLRHLGPTCSGMTCFLSCAHLGLNQRCPVTGNAFVEVCIKPLEDVAEKIKTASPALKKMVKKKLPTHCQPLLDIDYLNRLKTFGSLPDKKPADV